MKAYYFIAGISLFLPALAQGQSDIQSVNHLPVEEGGTPQCVNTLYSAEFAKCAVYKEGMKTADLVTRLWNRQRCTRYETVHYQPEVLKLNFGPTENFQSVSISVKSASGKTINGKVLIHKKSKSTCNIPPLAANDFFKLPPEQLFNGKVGINDLDEDEDFLTFRVKKTPRQAAQFKLNKDGSFSYVPKKGFMGKDTFSYSVSDELETSEATVYLEVLKYSIELVMAKTIELGCPRAPLEIRVIAPAENALQVKLTLTPGFPELTLWDATTGGKMITKTTWPAGKQPSTLWIDASGAAEIKAEGLLLAEGSVKAEDKKTANTHTVWPRRWCVANGNPGGSHGITTQSGSGTYSFDMIPKQDDLMADLMDALNKAAAEQPNFGEGEQGLFTEEPEMDEIQFGHSGSDKNYREIAINQCPGKTSHTVWRVEITPVSTPLVWKDNILLPVWNQRISWEKKLTPKARSEWDHFSKALKIHEEGHKRLFDPYRTACLKILDVFVKTKFIGEALSLGYGEKYNGDACAKAAEMAELCFDSSLRALNTKLKNLREEYERAQHDYETLTSKGLTQSEDPFTRKTYGKGISTKTDGDIPLLPSPPKPRTPDSPKNPPPRRPKTQDSPKIKPVTRSTTKPDSNEKTKQKNK